MCFIRIFILTTRNKPALDRKLIMSERIRSQDIGQAYFARHCFVQKGGGEEARRPPGFVTWKKGLLNMDEVTENLYEI